MSSGALETISSPRRSFSPLQPRSDLVSPKKMSLVRQSSKSGRENMPPPDSNVQIDRPVEKKSPSRLRIAQEHVNLESPVQERPPDETDSSVKVFVRVRPAHDHETRTGGVGRRVATDSLSFGEKSFSFDAVMGPESSQEEVFRVVGMPLVSDLMAGYNTSVVCYGESGSGKTYTLWGPPTAMFEENSVDARQGIAPRLFHMLFQKIQKNQENDSEHLMSFQCKCSFIEVYNDQINDLLDSSQRNLKIKDDAKNSFHVENLTEEYVTTVQDVIQTILKGLSRRRVGTTRMNSKSSRSHVIFTCVIESWCHGNAAKSFSNSKMSRISIFDLAGTETIKINEDDKYYTNEGRLVQKSLSSLGKLVSVLSGTRKQDNASSPYTDSCLTNLMRESLGGNSKTAFICTVSPSTSLKGTLSTLRFGQQVKRIQNKPVINEITEDYVDDLTNQIRHLKEELIREKSHQGSPGGRTGERLRVEELRQSVSLLRESLNRALAAPPLDDDTADEPAIEVNEDDVNKLCKQIGGDLQSAFNEEDELGTCESPKLSSSVMQEDEPAMCESPKIRSSVKKTRSSVQPSQTDSLAASLQRGLQAINYHERKSTSDGSLPISFSFDHLVVANPSEEKAEIISRRNELEKICGEQAATIAELTSLVEKLKSEREAGEEPLRLLREGPVQRSDSSSAIEEEREEWRRQESRWICLADELRIEIEGQRRLAEARARELGQERARAGELDDALRRGMLSQAKLIEHYAELQETHGELVDRHRHVMQGVAQVKQAAARAGAGRASGAVLAQALAAELSSLRVQREREIAVLKKQNRGLRAQLSDTADAVRAAGELLVRLREAEQAAAAAEGKWEEAKEEVEGLKKQMRKMKEKQVMEMETMKRCLATSRLPESALEPIFRSEREQDVAMSAEVTARGNEEEEAWRTAFVPAYR
ncbi:kinesin-like protein KIN-12C isoform X2 [Wolffia australiana]